MMRTLFRSASFRFAAIVFCLTVTATVAIAQDGVDPTTGAMPKLGDLFKYSITINTIIVLLSAMALAMFAYFMMTINAAAMAPTSFIDELRKLVLDGKFEQATEYCRSNRGVFASSILQRCVENAGKSHSVIMEILNTEGRRRADMLWSRISVLSDISNVAPLFGLLGTVLGMITSFFSLDRTTGSISSAALSQGVGQAMTTTMFGLIVGIIAMVCHSIVKNQAARALGHVEQTVHGIADHIKRGDA